MSDKPLVDPHLGPAPDDLLIEDLIVGSGAEALYLRVRALALLHSWSVPFDRRISPALTKAIPEAQCRLCSMRALNPSR